MKSFIVLAMLVAAALAAPVNPDAEAAVVRYEVDNNGYDGYNYIVETSNGISFSEEGKLKNVGTENEANSVRGQYSFTGPDGVVYSITYTADEEGFKPIGAHIPVGPN